MPENPDEVKRIADRHIAIAGVERKLVECNEIVNSLNTF
jgi:hypothetical protein